MPAVDLDDLLRRTSRTFALAIPLLDEPTRREVGLAYLLFRIADTFEDESRWPKQLRRTCLVEMAEVLDGKRDATETTRAWMALPPLQDADCADLVRQTADVLAALDGCGAGASAIVRKHVRRTALGMADVVESCDEHGELVVSDVATLKNYCYIVAGIVGEMLTELFVLDAPQLRSVEGDLAEVAATFDLLIDLGPTSFLTDAEGQPITWQPRAGKLDVRSAVTPRLLGVGAPKVHPGSGADVEIETAEPFALDSGVVEIHYPTDVLSGAPWVSADPRHGSVDFLVSEPQPGLLRIEFGSPGGDFNSVPGALFVLHLPTSPAVQIGVTRQISLEATTTELLAPGVPDPVAVDIRLNGDTLEFVSDPSVFYDNFEGGSLGGWSRRSP